MFKKAHRKQSKLRIALMGPSGSGKTYSALLIAKGLGGKICCLDTECGSASLYSNLVDFDVAEIGAPYDPMRYVEIIKVAENQGYNTIVIDSLSHAWNGEGGLLEMHDSVSAASKSKNSYIAWSKTTPIQNKLINTIVQSSINIIACLRTKTAYEIKTEGVKSIPVKVGLAPIQREGVEYEFTSALEMSKGGYFMPSKDRTGLFKEESGIITEKTGEMLAIWLQEGKTEIEVDADTHLSYMNAIKEAKNTKEMGEIFMRATKDPLYKSAPKELLQELIAHKDVCKSSLETPTEIEPITGNPW